MTGQEFTVLGASGCIGSALVRHLGLSGHRVRAVQRHEGVDGVVADRPLGHVIFAIGVTADFRSRPLDTMDAHVAQVTRVLRSCDFGSLTYLSSTRVYEGAPVASEDAALRVEPASPSALYNISKIAGESVCLNAGLANVRVVRLSNVVGVPRSRETFVDQLIAEGRANGSIRLRSHPDSVKDYVWSEDAMRLIRDVALFGRERIYNVASGEQTRHREVLELIVKEARWAVEVDEAAPKSGFPPVDVSLVRKEFEFVPVPFRDYFPACFRTAIDASRDDA